MELWGAVWVQSAPGLLGVPVPNLASTVTIFWFLALLQICVPLAKSLVACRRRHRTRAGAGGRLSN